MSITETDHSPTTVQSRAERRRHRRRIAAVVTPAALAALVLGLGAAGQLGNSVSPPWRPVQGEGRVPVDWVGVWVDRLPSGPVAQAAWVDGDTLHVGSHTVRITGRGIGASSPITLYAATEGGWFASVVGGPSESAPTRWGLIQPDGTFVEFQKYGDSGTPLPPLVSPDGLQAVLGGDNSGLLIDTATGRIIMHEPDFGAIAWGNDGIYALLPGSGLRAVLWKPGIGITKLSFDAHRCRYSTANTIAANLLAGYSGCRFPQLASTSPDGAHALVGSSVLDLGTGRRIQLAPQKAYGASEPLLWGTTHFPSYRVLWEDNEHALIELTTPMEPATAPGTRVQNSFVIVRCNLETGSCERASDPFSASEIGLAPLP